MKHLTTLYHFPIQSHDQVPQLRQSNTRKSQSCSMLCTQGPQCTRRLLETRFSVNSAPTNNLAVSVSPRDKAPPLYSHQSNPPQFRQDDGVTRCKVEAEASHTYGGGSYYQQPVDITGGGIYCYDVNDSQVYANGDANVDNFNGATNTVSGADCHTLGDVTFHTAYNSASNHFEICTITYNGADTLGVVTSSIDSGTVTVSSSYCTIYIPC